MAHERTVSNVNTQPSPEVIQAIVDQLIGSRAEVTISTPVYLPSTSRVLSQTPFSSEAV